METIKLNFDAEVLGKGKTITIEMPYSDGVVATSRFCPLEDFVKDCKLQLAFANKATEQSSLPEAFIAGLMASVMEHQARSCKLTMKDYLLHMDAFSYLINACGVSTYQVIRMYPKVLESVIHTIENR